MSYEIPLEQFSTTLDAQVRQLLDQAEISGPPVDAFRVAQQLGLLVAEDASQAGRGRFVRLASEKGVFPQGSILLRPEERDERRQFAVAHEIGESLVGELLEILGMDLREVTAPWRERLANRFASRLLLPTGWYFPRARSTGWDLFALKETFRTASHELIARRMLEAEEPVIVTLFDLGQITWRLANGATRPPRPYAEETACWQAAHDSGRPSHELAGQLSITCWPVHELDWKREILRTEPQEMEF